MSSPRGICPTARSGGSVFFDYGNQRLYASSISEDADYLIAAMFDSTGSFGGQRCRIAVWDGSTWTNTDADFNKSIRLQGLEIGSFNADRQMTGIIDDVRIYDHTLSLDELNALAGVGGPVIPEPSAFALAALGLVGLTFVGRRRCGKSRIPGRSGRSGDTVPNCRHTQTLLVREPPKRHTSSFSRPHRIGTGRATAIERFRSLPAGWLQTAVRGQAHSSALEGLKNEPVPGL